MSNEPPAKHHRPSSAESASPMVTPVDGAIGDQPFVSAAMIG